MEGGHPVASRGGRTASLQRAAAPVPQNYAQNADEPTERTDGGRHRAPGSVPGGAAARGVLNDRAGDDPAADHSDDVRLGRKADLPTEIGNGRSRLGGMLQHVRQRIAP